jgi:hypothetical protein
MRPGASRANWLVLLLLSYANSDMSGRMRGAMRERGDLDGGRGDGISASPSGELAGTGGRALHTTMYQPTVN